MADSFFVVSRMISCGREKENNIEYIKMDNYFSEKRRM